MAPSNPRPLWGWTASVRAWFAALGALAAVGLIAGSPIRAPERAAAPAPQLIVDPNTVSPEILGALPKMGPSMVGKIVAARDQARFRSLDDLRNRVRGVGPATLASLQPYLRIDPDPRPSPGHPARP